MPELRKDAIANKWVIIAEERGKRPSEFNQTPEEKTTWCCPFCEGKENFTPGEVMAYRLPGTVENGEGWLLRVVPNKFPALVTGQEMNVRENGVYTSMNGIGIHEVVIETPEHHRNFHTMSLAELTRVIRAYKERYLALQQDDLLQYVLIFRNYGRIAGASLEHPHSQLIATPLVPPGIKEEMRGARDYFNRYCRCVYCAMAEDELTRGERLIAQNDHFLAMVPYAARLGFETWIMPKAHCSNFETISEDAMKDFAGILHCVFAKLAKALDTPPYNFVLHTNPLHYGANPYYHWHLEIMPKLSTAAGFELGAGIYINVTSPETAARLLREAEA